MQPEQQQESIRRLHAELDERDRTIASLEERIRQLNAELSARDVDYLTGARTLRWLRAYWDVPSQHHQAVCFVDVDQFKKINDHHGHQVGDMVLCQVSAALMSTGCPVVRYGGDEFLLMVRRGVDVYEALDLAFKAIEIEIPGTSGLRPVVSCGVRIVADGDGAALHPLIRDADTAMYLAKRREDNMTSSYRTFDPNDLL